MSLYIGLFFASLGFIALRAFQQLNVQHDRYLWVPPVTTLMAICEVYAITAIVSAASLYAAIPMTFGGVLGCWFSMWLHKRLRAGKCKAH